MVFLCYPKKNIIAQGIKTQISAINNNSIAAFVIATIKQIPNTGETRITSSQQSPKKQTQIKQYKRIFGEIQQKLYIG